MAAALPEVRIARGLCAYAFFTPGAARGAAAWAAARLHARTAAPFVNAQAHVEKSGHGFSIWWWDLDRVQAALAERFGAQHPRTAPEAFVAPAGDIWRIVRASSGYDAQLWRGGGLVASMWRRAPFDAVSWDAFVRVQAERGDASGEPPAPTDLAAAPFPPVRHLAQAISGDRLLKLAPTVLAVLLLTASAFWFGQGLRLGGLSDKAEQAATLERGMARTAGADQARQVNQRLTAFRALADRPDVIEALTTATTVLRLYGVSVTAVAADGDELTMTIPYSAIGSVERVAREMEASGAFVDVRPITNAANHTIDLRMRLARVSRGG